MWQLVSRLLGASCLFLPFLHSLALILCGGDPQAGEVFTRQISSQEFVTSSSMKTLLSARAWRSVGRFGASSAVSYPSSIYRTLCQPLVR